MFTAMPTDRANASAQISEDALRGTRFTDLRWVPRTGSTNSDVLDLARDGAPEGTVLVADHQDEGRGRRGRRWVDRPGASLLLSVLLRPPAPVAGMTTMAVGVAMAEAVEQVAGFSPGLKWPNDLVAPGEPPERKLAGILAETDWPPGASIAGGWRRLAAHDRVAVVAGVGVNVDWSETDRSDLALEGGTALNLVSGRSVDRAELLTVFLQRLEEHYAPMVRDRSPSEVLAIWRDRSVTLSRRVRVELGSDDVEGTAVDVTGEGHLIVETLEGDRRTLAVGDIVHLRAH